MNRAFARPIFWPLVLIAFGVLWLLGSFGVISATNLWVLLRYWPVLLIAIGLDVIVRQRWPWIGNLITLITLTLAVLAVVFAPRLGLAGSGSGWFGSIPLVWGGEPGSGHVITETRNVSDFAAVSFSSFGEMTIQPGETESIIIEAEDNVLGDIRTEVRNGTLYIDYADENGWPRVRPTKPVRFTLTILQLNGLDLSGAGSVVVKALKTDSLQVMLSGAGDLSYEDLEADQLSLRLSGAGSIDASGRATELEARLSGFGSFKGCDLRSENADVAISGLGSAVVWTAKHLEANISGLGSVQYYGQPQVTKSVSGLGSVQHMGDK